MFLPPPYKKGFTLAEVLITLVIIGIIASLTVPSLINKIQNQNYVSRLKKAYSTLSQATNQIIANEGPVKTWATSEEKIFNLYKKHLIDIKTCSQQEQGCMYSGRYNYFNGGSIDLDSSHYYKITLSDGIQVMFWGNHPLCDFNENGSENICEMIFVDVNGIQKPNLYGRDAFIFVLKKNGLYPAGCDNTTNNLAGCGTNNYGRGCACKVLREGAMNY